MSFIDFFVKRPVTTIMFYATIILLGCVALSKLPIGLFPNVSYPQLMVVTGYASAASSEIENIITRVIEEQVGTIPNLKKIKSYSKEGLSIIVLGFRWGTDMGIAHLMTRERLDLIKSRLPKDADDPIIRRYNPFDQPIIFLSISSSGMHTAEITRLTKDIIKKRLHKVDGIGAIVITGGRDRNILIEADAKKTHDANVSLFDIAEKISNTNINYPAGTTKGVFYEYLLRTVGEYTSIHDIRETIVGIELERDNYRSRMAYLDTDQDLSVSFQPKLRRVIYLKDVASIKDTFSDIRSYSSYNGENNISISIKKQFNVNTIEVIKNIKKTLQELKLSLPENLKIKIIYDKSQFIKKSLTEILLNAIFGSIFSFFVIFFFLRRIRDSIVITFVIPITFTIYTIFLYFMGGSINIIALLGVSLAIGSITDNAICVLDNIDKYRKKGYNAIKSSILAPKNIFIAQITSMFTNIAVFLPLLFGKGLSQQLFKDLFFAITITNIAALFISVTFCPRMVAYSSETYDVDLPKRKIKDKSSSIWRKIIYIITFQWLFNFSKSGKKYVKIYFYILKYCLIYRWLLFFILFISFILSIYLLFIQDKIFMPSIDEHQFIMRYKMPVGTKLSVTTKHLKDIEKRLLSNPVFSDVLVQAGSTGDNILDNLGDHEAEVLVRVNQLIKTPTNDIIYSLKRKFDKILPVNSKTEYVIQDSLLHGIIGLDSPIEILIQGYDLEQLEKISKNMMSFLSTIHGVYSIKSSFSVPSAENKIIIDKYKASLRGVTVSDIARISVIGVRGQHVSDINLDGVEVPIILRLKQEDRDSPKAIKRLVIPNQRGQMISLEDVSQIQSGYGPSEIQRVEQQRAITVFAQIFDGTLDSILGDIEKYIKNYNASNFKLTLKGAKQQLGESYLGFLIAIILSICLIYMIMAAGFESLLHPFLIMITVPFGIIGVAFFLYLFNIPISAPVFLGILLLVGISVNNGIILVEYINRLRLEDNFGLLKAVFTGCMHRLRPICMTALTNILALSPIAFGLVGDKNPISSVMASTTLSGIIISTLLTLVILPTLYFTIEKNRS